MNSEWHTICIPIDIIFKIKCLQVNSILEKFIGNMFVWRFVTSSSCASRPVTKWRWRRAMGMWLPHRSGRSRWLDRAGSRGEGSPTFWSGQVGMEATLVLGNALIATYKLDLDGTHGMSAISTPNCARRCATIDIVIVCITSHQWLDDDAFLVGRFCATSCLKWGIGLDMGQKEPHAIPLLVSQSGREINTCAVLGSECFANLFWMDGWVAATGDLWIGSEHLA